MATRVEAREQRFPTRVITMNHAMFKFVKGTKSVLPRADSCMAAFSLHLLSVNSRDIFLPICCSFTQRVFVEVAVE